MEINQNLSLIPFISNTVSFSVQMYFFMFDYFSPRFTVLFYVCLFFSQEYSIRDKDHLNMLHANSFQVTVKNSSMNHCYNIYLGKKGATGFFRE